MADSFGHGNEPSGSIKWEEFLDYAELLKVASNLLHEASDMTDCFLCSWVRASWISVTNCPTWCDNIQFYYISANSYTCFRWYLHPSSGAHANCNYSIWKWSNRIATVRYCGGVGTTPHHTVWSVLPSTSWRWVVKWVIILQKFPDPIREIFKLLLLIYIINNSFVDP